MYINFWYPVLLSKELKDAPIRVRMLGQNFVAFRDSKGKANTLSDICPHRGGALSGGIIKENCIQCPYHGWRFDGEGHCHRIPSLGKDAKFQSEHEWMPIQLRNDMALFLLSWAI